MKNFQQPKEKSKETICGGSVSAIEDMIMKGRNLNEIIESTENKDQKHNLMQLVSFFVSHWSIQVTTADHILRHQRY